LDLVKFLWNHSYYISIETNGSKSIEPFLDFANIVMDYKLPSSGQEKFMKLDNFYLLKATDYVKFVIQDREDYERAKTMVKGREKCRANISFSPTMPGCNPLKLMEWIEDDELFDIQVNIQIHKLVGIK